MGYSGTPRTPNSRSKLLTELQDWYLTLRIKTCPALSPLNRERPRQNPFITVITGLTACEGPGGWRLFSNGCRPVWNSLTLDTEVIMITDVKWCQFINHICSSFLSVAIFFPNLSSSFVKQVGALKPSSSRSQLTMNWSPSAAWWLHQKKQMCWRRELSEAGESSNENGRRVSAVTLQATRTVAWLPLNYQ